ncbi:MAG: PilZ domain-containing protein [Endomicrobiales bacterium]|nr:PilZ domain-containing protein [Endomicrobiales bacterium]
MLQEKRRHNRLPVLHEMDEPIQLAIGEKNVPGILVDLSAGGMALLAFASIPVGSEINLSIDIKGLKTQPISGKVVWTLSKGEMWRIGIVFTKIDPLDFRHINRLAIECQDCDNKYALGVTDICSEKCSYFPLCDKPVKLGKKHGGKHHH